MKLIPIILIAGVMLLPFVESVCIEVECPYKCCVDNNSCNTRPDCLLEDSQYCIWSSDCLNGCCHGKVCHPMKDCEDYEKITGIVLGIFFLFLICFSLNFVYAMLKHQKTRHQLASNRKVVSIYQGFMAKNLTKLIQNPMFLKIDGFKAPEKKEINDLEIPEEQYNLNPGDEDKPITNLNETAGVKKAGNI